MEAWKYTDQRLSFKQSCDDRRDTDHLFCGVSMFSA
jgi:hypothetical protein